MNMQRAEALADASAFFVDHAPRWRQLLIPGLSLLLLAVALSQPRWGVEHKTASRPLDSVWFVIDVGSTMRCRDLPGGRGEFAKSVASVVAGNSGGKARLSVFENDARLISPSTVDVRRTQRMIERLEFAATTSSSLRALVDLIRSSSLSEPFLGVVFTDGGRGDVSMEQSSTTTNERWIVVGLGNPEMPTPVPAPDGGWMIEAETPVVSKRSDLAIKQLSNLLNASVLPAWPDAAGVAAKILLERRGFAGEAESMDVVPHERFQWFAAAALAILLQPWKWRLGVKSVSLIVALALCAGSVHAEDARTSYQSALSELAAKRWFEARIRFDKLTQGSELAGWAHWGSGCAAALQAQETTNESRRRELVATAIRSFREAVRRIDDPSERAAVMNNIGVAKRMLDKAMTDSKSASDAKGDPAKGDSAIDNGSSVAKENPNVDRKAGNNIGGGEVERPVAGLGVPDPGPLSRDKAEAIIDDVVRTTELAPHRAGVRPKQ